MKYGAIKQCSKNLLKTPSVEVSIYRKYNYDRKSKDFDLTEDGCLFELDYAKI